MIAADSQRTVLATAAERLLAQNNTYGPGELVLTISVLFFSLIMLKDVFRKWVAFPGIIIFAIAVIGGILMPILGVAYLWWWAFFFIWLIAVGIKPGQLSAI